MIKVKKGYEIRFKLCVVKPEEFNAFAGKLEMCYNDVCREMRAKKTMENNQIGIDFTIYEIELMKEE